jgi:hypothetical protein
MDIAEDVRTLLSVLDTEAAFCFMGVCTSICITLRISDNTNYNVGSSLRRIYFLLYVKTLTRRIRY